MDLPEAKRGANAFDLLDVVGDRVEARAARAVGLPATKLVGDHDPIPKLSQALERQKVVVGGTGAATPDADGAFRRVFVRAPEKVESRNLFADFDRVHPCNGLH